jgi:hypothetical protein
MKWRRIPKETSTQPKSGKYSDWKHLLAAEGQHQCVYCALHDATFGERNFHVEHYKPKSKRRFKHLENVFSNLFYACPVCNIFKSDSWPGEPKNDHSREAYPNPATCDYSDLFEVSPRTGQTNGKFVASRFLIARLHLNREQLVTERRIFYNDERMLELNSYFGTKKNDLVTKAQQRDKKAMDLISRLLDLYTDMQTLQVTYRQTPTYIPKQYR